MRAKQLLIRSIHHYSIPVKFWIHFWR